MKKLKGWRTLIGMIVGGLAAIATIVGVDVTEADQGAIIGVLIAIYGIFMRFQTDTAIGDDE